jgi:hypothetical protein
LSLEYVQLCILLQNETILVTDRVLKLAADRLLRGILLGKSAVARHFGGRTRKKGSRYTIMARLGTFSFLLASGTILCATALMAQEVSPAVRVVDRVDESRLVVLKGNTHPSARAANDRGRVSPDLPMTDLILVLSRSPEQQAAFDSFVASQYDRTSPNYHQWLEPEEVGERFGPAQGDIDAVTGWLRGHGFSVDEVMKNHMSIRFSGTAGQVESTFHTEIHNLEVKGVRHIGNMTDPQIPAALAPAVVGVKALHNFFPRPLHRMGGQVARDEETGKWKRVTAAPNTGAHPGAPFVPPPGARPLYGINDPNNGLIEDVTPYDFAAIYNVLPLWNAGIDGTGQTIVIAATSDINAGQSAGSEAQSSCSPSCTGATGQNDVLTFRKAFDLPTGNAVNTPIRVSGNSQPLTVCTDTTGTVPYAGDFCTADDLFENSLDVELSGSVAKNAQVVLVASYPASSSDDALWDSENYVVNNVGNSASPVNSAHIMSVSYGECELFMGTGGNVEYYNLWQTAASEGIAVFVATGDSGSPSCDQGMDQEDGTPYAAQFGLSVSGMASTPYNTAVGGTDFNWGSTASPYWNTSNSSTTGASAAGYIPEVPWNDTCTNSLLDSEINTQFKSSYTAAQICDYIYDEYIYSTSDESALQSLVDTVGGSGGKSGCVANDGEDTSSCGTATSVSTGSGSIPLVKDGWPKPSWQAGVAGIPADGVRDIPDVSFFASNGFWGSAYLICDSDNGSCTYSATSENQYQEVGGTSASTPAMASVMALINQKAGTPQGNPNASLYYLAAKQAYSSCSAASVKASSTSCYFNDINSGTIAMACFAGSPNCTVTSTQYEIGVLSGYAAAPGYDLATGLGSLNVDNVVKNWPGPIVPVASLTPSSLAFASTVQGTSATAQAITLKNGGNATMTGVAVSISGNSSFTQTNNCGTSLAAGASCAITVKFTPASVGQLSATVSVADNATGSPQTVSISGTGALAAPAVSLSAAAVTFASTPVNTAATAQKITVTNSGTAALAWSSLAVSIGGANPGSYSQTNTCTSSLAVKGACVITVTFKPAAIGALSATVNLADNAAGSPQTVSLSGTGTGAAVSLSTAGLTFAGTAVGSSAATQTVTLTNTGNAALTLASSAITITGTNAASFSESSACGASVAANGSCKITVSFKPAASGALSATLNIADNAAGSPQQVTLGGTGLAPAVSLSASSLTFPGTPVGTSAATQQIVVSNTGSAPLTMSTSAITITGTNASAYSQTNNCGTSVAVSGGCTITVSFKPAATGTLTATVNLADNASGSPQKATLSGTGTAPVVSLTPATLTFSGTQVGNSAATQNITLKNTGAAPLSLNGTGQGISITGTGGASFSQTNACGTSVAAGASCLITVTFTPQATGTLTAKVSVADNATGSPQTVSLTGTGTAPAVSLSVTSLTFAGTLVGVTSSTQAITLKNTGTATLSFSGTGQGISISGAGASSFSQVNNCNASLGAGANCAITVSFTPAATGVLTATIIIADNAAGSPQKVTLSGTGTAPAVSLSPTLLAFSGTLINTGATAQKITLKNTGTGALSLGSGGISIIGTNASSFSQTNTCGASLAAAASCIITVGFKPAATGVLSAAVMIADNASGSPQTVALTGTGTAPAVSFSAASLTFASTKVGTTATATQKVTLTNTGTGALTLSGAGLGISITGTNASSFSQTNTCGTSVAAGASCTITVSFKPTAAVSLSAAVKVADNASDSPESVGLSGTGQ